MSVTHYGRQYNSSSENDVYQFIFVHKIRKIQYRWKYFGVRIEDRLTSEYTKVFIVRLNSEGSMQENVRKRCYGISKFGYVAKMVIIPVWIDIDM